MPTSATSPLLDKAPASSVAGILADAQSQFISLLESRWNALNPILGTPPLPPQFPKGKVTTIASSVTAALCSEDSELAAKACDDVLDAFWPSEDAPPPLDFWRSPLGRLCARTLTEENESISYSTAAIMLGVHQGTVATLAHRGQLEKHEVKGIRNGAVFERLARGVGVDRD